MANNNRQSNREVFAQIKGYTLPTFHQKSQVYVSFTAFDPALGKMRQKKIMLGRIKTKRAQRAEADRLISDLTAKLMSGWNPWIEAEAPTQYTLWKDVVSRYKNYLEKLYNEGSLREDTFITYTSRLHILERFITKKKIRITYSYQFDAIIVGQYLDYVFIERNNTIRTRNSYLVWLKNFCHYLVERRYVKTDPAASFSHLKVRDRGKNREVIPDDLMSQIHDYLDQHNRHFLLACYMCHYCLIRPKEMSHIQLRDISIRKQTLTLHGSKTKNHHDAVITLPAKVIRLMIDLGVLTGHHGGEYLFSEGCRPGPERYSEKQFRDYWTRVLRKELDFSERYKFYSLKDTGITNMLRQNVDILTVRDQARHSSILITDIYTPKDIKEANELLLNYEGIL